MQATRRTRSNKTLNRLAGILLATLGLGSCAAAQEPVSIENRPLLAAMREKGAPASLTVVPTIMLGEPNRDVADVIGLMLEKHARMPNVETTDAAFQPPANIDAEKLPEAFGAWVKNNPIATDYALFAQILGTPQTGATEIRIVLADQAGTVVWSECQTPESATFKRIRPRNPMSCSTLVAERVKAALDLPRPGDPAVTNGNMARRWAEKSGTPTKDECRAMKARLKVFKEKKGKASVVVFAPQVNNAADSVALNPLVELLIEKGFAGVRAAEEQKQFQLTPSSNEQKRLWDLARAFREYVRQNPPKTDYALFAEYALDVKRQKVHIVHFVVCDRAGEWVIVDFQNSHHRDFKRIAPKTIDDCHKLLAVRLKRLTK